MLGAFCRLPGNIAAENIADLLNLKNAIMQTIPNCIFTDPEIASVGLTEEEAKIGIQIKINKFDFMGSGMARILDETEGFIKIISDKKTDSYWVVLLSGRGQPN